MIIYRVTNKLNGKSYIGQTARPLEVRRGEHLRSAFNLARAKYPAPLHLAISQDGKTNFEWEVLETGTSPEHLNERECFYIKLLKTQVPHGYNQTVGGWMTDAMGDDIREKIAASMREAHKDPEYRAKHYPKLKGLVPPNKGVPMSEEQKVKVGKARQAVYADPDYVNPNVGQKRTGVALDNLREALKERTLPTGDAWKAAHGDQYTAEVREKMSQKRKGKKPANTKQVMCVETGDVYAGLTEAAKGTGANRQSIYLQIKGKLKKAGGFTFRYV